MIGNFTKKRFHGIIILYIIDAMEPFEVSASKHGVVTIGDFPDIFYS